nr:D-alanine--D-alanine ligase [Alkalisalibacterium limincola]
MTGFAPLRKSDPAVFGRVAVLMGGTSAERDVSLNSGRGVLAALRARGIDAQAVDGVPALVEAIREGRVDRVFNVLHGSHGGGEDGVLQGLLEALGVPCTGSGVLGSALSMDKIRSKQVWQAIGLPTPGYVRLQPGDDIHDAAKRLGLPVIVKPACEGSSVGITRVLRPADLEDAVALGRRYPGELLMEQLIEGGEFTVGVVGDVALPSIEIRPKKGWYDYEAKYTPGNTEYLCPGLDGEAEQGMRDLALEAFRALDCSGWGRVDFMRDGQGRNWLLEVNTAPGMTATSLVPKAAAAMGVPYEELCWRVLESTLAEGTR